MSILPDAPEVGVLAPHLILTNLRSCREDLLIALVAGQVLEPPAAVALVSVLLLSRRLSWSAHLWALARVLVLDQTRR
jgi:hypothetical protein